MVLKKVTDHLGRLVEFSYPPKRIISIVPAITHTLYTLQLQPFIVGRTRYCIFPKEMVNKAEIVGGTKRIFLEKIRSLQPDLIFAEKEENTKEIVEQLEKDFPVYVAEVQSVADVYKLINDLGELTDRKREAQNLRSAIESHIQSMPNQHGKRIAYVIWKNPYMVVGKNTYIHSLLNELGFVNAFSSFDGRYPVVAEEDFKKAQLDELFLATEPFPFEEEHVKAFQKMLPNVKVRLINGEMFWYGPKMIEAVDYFQTIFK
ncbi:ABC transporter substrate-binding protein [Fervidibacillus halotolerans]|uniref:Helical backbone metal receptor n=1 Tax=Fervidibacillus halotolerans TaxID=2980027 RepID=A0A9E8M299_9BACI|nr:helical backbone metal receptor [Fervidibacillus halotolerans]WAA13151.1 helical backbone metal receptor [Fervidibacillus halotolerans]